MPLLSAAAGSGTPEALLLFCGLVGASDVAIKTPTELKNKKRGTKEIHKINTFIHCIYIYIQILFGCAVYIGVFV